MKVQSTVQIVMEKNLLKTPKYDAIKYCFTLQNMDLLMELINRKDFMDQDWSDDFSEVLSIYEYLEFVGIVSSQTEAFVPTSLIDKSLEVANNNVDLIIECICSPHYEQTKKVSHFLSMLFDTLNGSLLYLFSNNMFDGFYYKLGEDFHRKVFKLPWMNSVLSHNYDYFNSLAKYNPDLDLYNVMPEELYPYIAFTHDDRSFWSFIYRWFGKLANNERELLDYLLNKSTYSGNAQWISRDKMRIFLGMVDKDRSLFQDLPVLASKYFYDNCMEAFSLLVTFDDVNLKEELLNQEDVSEELIYRLHLLLMIPANKDNKPKMAIRSIKDIFDIPMEELEDALPTPKKEDPDIIEIKDPETLSIDRPFFTYIKALAFIDPDGEFEEFRVTGLHADVMRELYKIKCPNGTEAREFMRYADVARNGTIVFVIMGEQVSIISPCKLTEKQAETQRQKICEANGYFELYAYLFGEGFAQKINSGYMMDRLTYLTWVKRLCHIELTNQTYR
jgi:hypothetical protein